MQKIYRSINFLKHLDYIGFPYNIKCGVDRKTGKTITVGVVEETPELIEIKRRFDANIEAREEEAQYSQTKRKHFNFKSENWNNPEVYIQEDNVQ
jgi:hypothetical protein